MIVVTSLPIRIDRPKLCVPLPKGTKPGGEGIMNTAKPPTEATVERAIASQDHAADDSERVPTHGRDWLFLIASAGIAALLAVGTSLVSTFAANTFWAYVTSAACAIVSFFLLFLGFHDCAARYATLLPVPSCWAIYGC